jgi:hypothetical protein
MKLKFYGRNEHTVHFTGRSRGQPDRIIGKTFVPANGKEPPRYALNKDPEEIDSANTELAEKCKRAVANPNGAGLWPADKETAAFCGVEFVPVEFDADGDWSPARKPAAKKSEPKAEI